MSSLWESFVRESKGFKDNAFADIKTAEEWQQQRPVIKKQFMHSMGLYPLPEKCDPKVTEYGSFSAKGFKAKKVAYQILPDCWGAGSIYYPDPLPKEKVPGILYVCGHNSRGSYGFQYHAAMWARKGYVCLIIDTIEQNDNPGEHGGVLLNYHDHWLSMGYTAAGGETFNAIRALDVLEAEELVDENRLGVTGVSGGGACSFHLAIADERIKTVSTLCGICSPYDAIANRHMVGHCDCMFPNNIYKRDISEYAALIAPRAVQFCSAIQDSLYHPEEQRGIAERTKYIYKLLGKEDCWDFVEDAGPHGDHPKFNEETNKWFDKHLMETERPPLERGEREISHKDTSIFNGVIPQPDRLNLLPQLISKSGSVRMPASAEEWTTIKEDAINCLKEEVPGFSTDEYERRFEFKIDADWRCPWGNHASLTSLHKATVEGVDIFCKMQTPVMDEKKIILTVGSEGEYDQAILGQMSIARGGKPVNIAALEPRIGGGNLPEYIKDNYPVGSRMPKIRKLFMRAMQFIGTTPAMLTFTDIGIAINLLKSFEDTKDFDIYLHGKADSAIAALYRGILDERVKGVILEDIPLSHKFGAPVIGIMRAFDIHHAIGLIAPKKASVINPSSKRCPYFMWLYDRIGIPEKFLSAGNLQQALEFMYSS